MDAGDPIHEANRRHWDASAEGWQQGIEETRDWRGCPENPHLALTESELRRLGDVADKDVCVLGSGDNLVVFALAGLGARVTSVDISENQLDIAEGRARELGLSIAFVRHDVTRLASLRDATFDIVYTGGHVAVWVSDLERYYAEAVRILRPGKLFLVNEYHPFRRVWKWGPGPLEIEFSYFDRGPHSYDSESLTGAKQHEFHWNVSDFIAAMIKAGCELTGVEEFGDGVESWEAADMKGLPQCLLLEGRKRVEP